MNKLNGNIELVINGEQISIDIDEVLEITNISEDMDKVSSYLGYFGSLWSEAEKEKALADAFYRQWRASEGKVITESNSKVAEWKIKQEIESKQKFLKIKKSLAQATHNVILCKTICEALKIKANMLQSKGAMMRAELDSTGMHTKTETKSVKVKKFDSNDPKSVMRNIYKNKKK